VVGLDFPAYTFTKAASAAFNPDNSRSTRSRSFFNCCIIPDKFAIDPPSAENHSRLSKVPVLSLAPLTFAQADDDRILAIGRPWRGSLAFCSEKMELHLPLRADFLRLNSAALAV
jgi:hypothetical protein